VGEAFLVLFKIATLSGWGDTTRVMIATRGESEPPGMVYTYLSVTPLGPSAAMASLAGHPVVMMCPSC
jgi:hypothetical protein